MALPKIKASDRVALVGMTGGGKTFLAQKLLATAPRLICCDPKGTLARKTEWQLTDWAKGKRAIEAGKPGRLRVPDQLDDEAWDVVFRWIFAQRNVITFIDEIYLVTPPRGTRALRALYTSGREKGLGTWGCTQRPVDVPGYTLSEAEWKIMFYLDNPDDRERMAKRGMGPAAYTDLKEYWYLVRRVGMRTPLLAPPWPAAPQPLTMGGG